MSALALAAPALRRLPWGPVLFILMWSSGYVAGKIGLPHSGPFTLLSIRFASAALVLLLVALLTRAPWPGSVRAWGHLLVVGLLIQALHFSCLYLGLSLGVPAGVSALITGLMPVFTALGAVAFLGERVGAKQVAGLFIGLVGVSVVVSAKWVFDGGGPAGYLCMLAALGGITLGTLYQKKFCAGMDLRTGGCIQLGVASAVVGLLACLHETGPVHWSFELLASSLWLSLVNSIGAISLLFVMMRRGEASQVAGLFYLIPSATALMGFFCLGETLDALQVMGFVVSAGGVYLSTRD